MEKTKKTGKIILDVLLYAFLVLCIITVIITLASKRNSDGAVDIFGYQMRIVTSDSMAACEHTDVSEYEIKDIPIRSLVFIKSLSKEGTDEWYRSLRKGDVLTFRYVYDTQVTITHRITEDVVEKPDGGFIIKLSGDNKSSRDGVLEQTVDTSVPDNPNYVIGKVTGQSYILGVIMSFLMSTLGMILLIMVPCVVIILLEVVKIVKTIGEDKKKQADEESARKDSEINELKKRLAELEKNAASGEGGTQ